MNHVEYIKKDIEENAIPEMRRTLCKFWGMSPEEIENEVADVRLIVQQMENNELDERGYDILCNQYIQFYKKLKDNMKG